MLGRLLAKAEYLDDDEMIVRIVVNTDETGRLFEMDLGTLISLRSGNIQALYTACQTSALAHKSRISLSASFDDDVAVLPLKVQR